MAQRIMALDVGDRRIGVAATDALGLTAQPVMTLERKGPRADAKSIARLVRRHQAATVIVGLPLHEDGSESAQAAKTRAFVEALRPMLGDAALEFVDERLTTRDAHALLNQGRRLPRSAGAAARLERRDVIDQAAAVLLLESFLAQRRGPALLPDPDETPV